MNTQEIVNFGITIYSSEVMFIKIVFLFVHFSLYFYHMNKNWTLYSRGEDVHHSPWIFCHLLH